MLFIVSPGEENFLFSFYRTQENAILHAFSKDICFCATNAQSVQGILFLSEEKWREYGPLAPGCASPEYRPENVGKGPISYKLDHTINCEAPCPWLWHSTPSNSYMYNRKALKCRKVITELINLVVESFTVSKGKLIRKIWCNIWTK